MVPGLVVNVICMVFNISVFVQNLRLILAMRKVGVWKNNATCMGLGLTAVFNVAMFLCGCCYCVGMTTLETNPINRNALTAFLGIMSLVVMPTVLTIPLQWMDIALSMESTEKQKLATRFKYTRRFIYGYSIFFAVVAVGSILLQRNDIVSMLIVFSYFVASIAYRIGARKLATMLDYGSEASKTAAKNMLTFSNHTQVSFVLVWLAFILYGQAVGSVGNAQVIMFYIQIAFGSMVASLYFNFLYVKAGFKKKLEKGSKSSSKVGVSTMVSSTNRRGSTQVSQAPLTTSTVSTVDQ